MLISFHIPVNEVTTVPIGNHYWREFMPSSRGQLTESSLNSLFTKTTTIRETMEAIH